MSAEVHITPATTISSAENDSAGELIRRTLMPSESLFSMPQFSVNDVDQLMHEVLASVLLAELNHYNAMDTLRDPLPFGDPSIGITQMRAGTVVDRELIGDSETACDLHWNPQTAIQLLAADILHVAQTVIFATGTIQTRPPNAS